MENVTQKNMAGTLRRAAVLACIAVVVGTVYPLALSDTSAGDFLWESAVGRTLMIIFAGFAGLSLAELVWRVVLVIKYRPISGRISDDCLPTCTIVVPAYNEGRQVFKTLESLAASNYPQEKIQLIAVDDGSVDDTWKWIREAKRVLSRPILTLKQPRNKGKRHALYAGFCKSTGQILVTVDSDSTVEADTLRNLLAPFTKTRKVGAVAGNVRVLNRDKGIIPRMVDVIFVYSFDFMRASQSMVRAVTCTPGALSAYRKSVIMNVLTEWLEQTFCGRPANIGEDRAMTNLILREGYDVVFQQNAKVFTEVPVRYSQLCKMYLRWARSNVRETIAMTRFIFTPFREGSKTGARINLVSDWLALTKAQILLMTAQGLILWHPEIFGSRAVFGIILGSSLSAALYAWKSGRFSAMLAFLYGFFFFASLSWIKPYALVTPHKSGWLTRQINLPDETHPLVRQKSSSSAFG